MAVVTMVIKDILAYLNRNFQNELSILKLKACQVPEEIPVITFSEAQEIIYEEYGEDCRTEKDLAPQHERWLGEWAIKTHQSDFLFVTEYPMVKRPFYTHPHPASTNHGGLDYVKHQSQYNPYSKNEELWPSLFLILYLLLNHSSLLLILFYVFLQGQLEDVFYQGFFRINIAQFPVYIIPYLTFRNRIY